jgi:hypothetical protein
VRLRAGFSKADHVSGLELLHFAGKGAKFTFKADFQSYNCIKHTFMKKAFIVLLTILLMALSGMAQEVAKDYRNFPIIITLQFHNFSLPGRDIKGNFANPGIGIGTEFSFNGKQNWVQQVNAVWFRNKTIGNGLMFYTQPVWRPTISRKVYSEIKLGLGYLIASRPTESFRQVNGNWISVGHQGKGMLTIPVGISFGYNATSTFSPFVSYQFMVVNKYNTSIPIVPETLIQAGSRMNLNYSKR